ncbi:SLC13 family permease [Haloplanus salilacus]|uniref:SLC13 family permease n=1 Tax=Haloplanus salilacus TaxID=2949994 RepID=UPI0030D2DEA7
MTRATTEPRLTQVIGLLVAVAVLGGGTLGPTLGGVDRTVQVVLAVFASTLVFWIAKPVPYTVSSLLCVVLVYALGVTETFEAAVSGFASTLVFFFVVLLLVGQSVANVGLDGWAASRLIAASSTPRGSVARLAAMLLALAFVLPSGLARGVTFMPVIDRINASYGASDGSQFRRLAYYVVGHLNPVASLALMTGGGMAIATAELINASVRPITWVEWALYMAPTATLLFVSCTVAGVFLYDVDAVLDGEGGAEAGSEGAAPDASQTPEDITPDPLTREQKLVLGTLGGAICLWIVGSFTGVPTLVPAVLVVAVFALPGVGIIDAGDVSDINWGIIFLVGAMLSLLKVMRDVGAFDLLVDGLAVVVPAGASPVVVVGVVFGIAVLVRGTFSSVSASFVVLFPIVLEALSGLGLTPLYVSFALTTILMAATFLPFNNPVVLVAYERGPLDAREVFGLGLVTLALGVLVVAFGWTVYWPWVDRVVAF